MAGLRGNSPKRPAGPGASSTTAKASTIPQQQSKSVESTGVIKTVFIQVLELYMTMNVTCNGRTSDKLAKINDIVCRRTDPTRNVVNWQAEIRSLAKPQQKKGQGPKSKVRKLFNQQFVIQGDPEVGTFRTARAWIPTCTLHVWW